MCAQRMRIYLKDKVMPYRVSAPRPIPLRFQEAAASKIAKHKASGIITPCDEPTDWCSPAFFVPKDDGKRVQLVTYYTKLNHYVVCPVHPFPSVSDILQSIPASAACFAKLDATHGYFQIPLDEEASKLTTFILPSGRYRYLRAPMGLSSSLDEWCRHSNRVIEGFPWCRKIVDNILVWAATPSEFETRLHLILQRCEKLHVTLSKSKFHINNSLNFAGCVISDKGVFPDAARVSALSEFPVPLDQTGVRSFLGLCNQLAFFIPNFQHHTVALRQLAGKGHTFIWLPEHQVEFDTLKKILSGNLIVRHFDSRKSVFLLTDAASHLHGLGYALGHMEHDGNHKPVFKIVHCGSKGLTPTQQRYSTIELECLAIIWAIQKCHFYLRGLPLFQVYTDHRSLEGVFHKDIFDLASPRLQCLREKVAMYTFRVSWDPGKTHLIADALSRAPLFAPEEHLGLEIDTAISCLTQTSHPTMDLIFKSIDDDYRLLLSDVKHGTFHSTYAQSLKAYFDILSLSNGLVLMVSRRIVLPLPSVKPILKLLHASHSGISKTTFWQGAYTSGQT